MKTNKSYSTEETWDKIADSFDNTRKKPWSYCLKFIDNLPKTATVADLGCGNGRHLLPCSERCTDIIGLDISKKLLQIVQEKIKENNIENVLLIHGNLTNIPIKKHSVDAILYIASLHNISGKEERIRSLQEVQRILKNDGIALISVWSRWQEKYRRYFLKQYIFRKKNREFGDIDINWKQNNLDIPRFYHLYSKREFINDLKKADFKIQSVESVRLHSRHSDDNYFAVVRKQ